jgi:hypothetical protein
VYDIYPETLAVKNSIHQESWVYKGWYNLNRLAYLNALTVYTISNTMAKQLTAYSPDLSPYIIPNWSNGAIHHTLTDANNPFTIKYEQHNILTLIYSGNMGSTHDLECILHVAEYFKLNKEVSFFFIGDGPSLPGLISLAAKLKLTNLIFLPYQNSECHSYALSCADIGIVCTSAGIESLSLPSKTYNLLASATALMVIAPPQAELSLIVDEYNCGRHFQPQELNRMIGFIDSMLENKVALNQFKDNALQASKQFTSVNAHQYLTLFTRAYVQKMG